MEAPHEKEDDNLVAPGGACPRCGERDMDQLVWLDDDSDRVRCQRCRMVYEPGGRGSSDEQR